MRIGENTTLGQVAQFMSGKGNEKVLAKKVGDQIELYTKPRSNILDKLRTTVYEGTKMTRAEYKKQLAKDTIKSLVDKYDTAVSKKMNPVRLRANMTHDLSNKMMEIFDNISENLLHRTDRGAVRSDQLFGTFGAMEKIATRLTNLMDRFEFKETNKTMPETANRQVEGNVILSVPKEKDRAFPIMNIDGKLYTPDKVLGVGGNGVVVRYQTTGGDPIAVKMPVLGALPGQQKPLFLEEYHIAQKLTNANPNVIGFNKVVTLGDGGLALAGPLAPNGDLESMRDKLNDVTVDTGNPNIPPPPGKISKQERELIALTLIKDAAAGLDKIKRSANHIHGDVKSQNIMIGKNGNALIIDLGESVEGNRVNPIVRKMPDNPLYAAPELTRAKKDGEWAGKLGVMTNKQELRREVMEFVTQQGVTDEQFATISDGWFELADKLAEHLQPVLTNVESERHQVGVGSKIDVWGLGTVAFELLIGERLSEEKIEGIKFDPKKDEKIAEWTKSSQDAIGNPNGLSSKSTGDIRLDGFINSMLHSDVDARVNASQIETSPLMGWRGVGEPEVRELIKAIASGTEKEIATARTNLAKFLGKV